MSSLSELLRWLTRLDVPYLVTGSVGAMAYGEPRLTNDIDIVAAIEQSAGAVSFYQCRRDRNRHRPFTPPPRVL